MRRTSFGRAVIWAILGCMLFSMGMTAAMGAPKAVYAADEAGTGTAWDGLSESDYVNGEVIVKFKEQLPARGFMSMASFESAAAGAGIELSRTQELARGTAVYETDGDVLETIAVLQNDPRVEYVQPNLIYRLAAFPGDAPNDARWSNQWGMHTATIGVNALEAWQHTIGNPNIIVAVIDTGVKYDHPDLQGQLTPLDGTNFVPNVAYNANQPMDNNNHGSHVAGIIAAAADNDIGVAGMAPAVRILPVKAQQDGEKFMDGAAIYSGIRLAAERGAKVVNMSFGGSGLDPLMYELIRDNPDITFVAAAGNDGIDTGEYSVFPANYTVRNVLNQVEYPALPNLVSVAALNASGNLASFSNYGQQEISLAAPGDQIVSTCALLAYCSMNGTSMATPFVAGAAALLYGLDDGLTPVEVIGLLTAHVTPLVSLTDKVKFGGTLNTAASVAYLAEREAPVTAVPAAGAVRRGASVTLAADTADADIYYTIDGSEPTEANGIRYDGAIAVSGPVTIKARAYADGKFHSKTAAFTYTLLSENAGLSALSVSGGVLSPAFAEETIAYAVSVANDVYEIEVTASTGDAAASLEINEAEALSGVAYGPVALAVGANAIALKVTAEDGVTTRTYSITVNRAALGGDANLSALSVSGGVLSPAFAPDTTGYAVSVANDVYELKVTATTRDAAASLTINGAAAVRGAAHGPIALAVGANTITVKVTAENGVETRTYSIAVNRAEAANSGGGGGNGGNGNGGGGGGGNGGTGAPVMPIAPPLEPVTNPAAEVSESGTITSVAKLDPQTGAAAAEIDDAALSEAAGKTAAGSGGSGGGGKTIEIVIPAVEGARSYDTTLPASALTASEADTRLQIRTEAGTLTVPANMLSLQTADAAASKVTLSMSLTDASQVQNKELRNRIGTRPVIQLQLRVDGTSYAWSNEDAPVTVSIPYVPGAEELADPEHLVIWYIDEDGEAIAVPSGRYDSATGTMTFAVTHFSEYAVAFVHRTFGDLDGPAWTWAQKPIEVLASKGIVNGTGADAFSPQADITRADFLVMLVRSLGLTAKVDDSEGRHSFEDVQPGIYYEQAVGIARKLGIVSGTGQNRFNPGQPISRQDMFVMTARALAISRGSMAAADPAAALGAFSDADDIANYARASLASLIREGYVGGDNGKLNPLSQTTRAEAAVLLYRIYHMYRLYTLY